MQKSRRDLFEEERLIWYGAIKSTHCPKIYLKRKWVRKTSPINIVFACKHTLIVLRNEGWMCLCSKIMWCFKSFKFDSIVHTSIMIKIDQSIRVNRIVFNFFAYCSISYNKHTVTSSLKFRDTFLSNLNGNSLSATSNTTQNVFRLARKFPISYSLNVIASGLLFTQFQLEMSNIFHQNGKSTPYYVNR